MPSFGASRVKAAQKKFVLRLLSQHESITDDPFMVIWKICVAARTKGAKYLEQLMCAGDVIEDDLVQRYQFVLNRASCNVDENQGTKLGRMYL